MPTLSVLPPYPVFADTDGTPLEDGYIWIGQANLDPQTFPITAYWDAALTIQAPQPIRTTGGYASRAGTPAALYTAADYSLRVMDKNGTVVYSAPALTQRFDQPMLPAITSADISFIQDGTGAEATTAQTKMRQTLSVFDFMTALEIADVQSNAGLLDVTQAIQDAINAVYSPAQNIGWGGTLLFPPGTYKTTAALTIDKHINIEAYGARINSSGARCFDIGNAAYLTNLALGYFRVRIAGLYINHAGASEVIRNQGIRRIVLERMQTIGGSHALYTEGAYDSPVILNCRFQNTTSHGINIAQRNNLLAIYNTAILGAAGYGVHMNTVSAELKGVKLYSADIEGCAGGIFIGGNTGNVLMDGCWFESNTVFNIRVDNTAGTNNKYGISIYNCQITGAGVDVLIGNDVAGTLIDGVSINSCEFVDSDLVFIGGDKVTDAVQFSNRFSGTAAITYVAAPLAGGPSAVMPQYAIAPTEPFGFAATGLQGDVRYGSGRMWVKNASGWLMLQGGAVDDYSNTLQSLPTGATPNVANLRVVKTNNSGAAVVLRFLNAYIGQELILVGADGGNTTVNHGTFIRMQGGTNFTLGDNDTLHLVCKGVNGPGDFVFAEVARSNNT